MIQPQNKSTVAPLIFANFIILVLALIQSWGVPLIIWTYWLQSVIIGIFHVCKIIRYKESPPGNIHMYKGKPVYVSPKTRFISAFFFLFHYGAFHIGFMMSLMNSPLPDNFLKSMGIAALVFFTNHLYSFFRHRDTNGTFFSPYIRVAPMHLVTYYFGSMVTGPLILIFFIFIKTVADVFSHLYQHKV
ncbi:MAG: hypothetical protein HOE80_04995 [Candidatus Magasanikbacteria bacterium]|jgi:hypothetical protein|nr:hypothetical protein [Candidatus Magasanikbacteria bacterium]MBT4072045.1 hypothetical protein [Candidatus Magasanikbacteria bacterium]